jgi:hypothetical protein
MRRSLITAIATFLLTLPALAQEASPSETAGAFYRWNLQHAGAGPMSAADLAPVKPLLSDSLYGKLLATEAKQDECVAATTGDEKPQLLEGDLFVNSVEGATRLDGLKENLDGDKAVVEASLSYVDARFPSGHRYNTISWTDAMQLQQIDGQWRIVDIRFEDGQSLVAVLDDYAQVDCTP